MSALEAPGGERCAAVAEGVGIDTLADVPKPAASTGRMRQSGYALSDDADLRLLVAEIDGGDASGAQVARLLAMAEAEDSPVLARCALALAIERQHAARETFVGLAAMNAAMLAGWTTDNLQRPVDPVAAVVLGIGEFLAALYTSDAPVALDAPAGWLLTACSQSSYDTALVETLARLRLRAASALLGYAELKDSAAVRTQIDSIAADAAALLPANDADVLAWWAERCAVACYAVSREKAGEAALRVMLAEQSERMGGRTGDRSIAAFKWWRAHLEIARHSGDVAAQDVALAGIERTIAPQRRAQTQTFLRIKAHVYVHRGMAREAERLARSALDVASEIAAPAPDVAAAVNVLALSLILQERWHPAAQVLREGEVGNHGKVAQHLAGMRLLIEAVAWWTEDRERALAALRDGFVAHRELMYYRFLASTPELAATLAARALSHDIEPEFVAEAVRRRGLKPPSRDQLQWPWAVRMKLFGGFELQSQDAAKAGSKAQQRPVELLQALALIGPAGADRREVSRRLYGSADAIAPVTIDMTVARARKLLGDDSLIVFEQGRLRLDATRVFVDVWAFDTVDAEIAERTAPTADPPRDGLLDDLQRLARAMTALYPGTLLAGDSTNIATHTLVQRYRERFVANAMRLAAALVEHAAGSDALGLLHRAIEREPDSEALYRALIERLIEEDEMAEAKRWYERCETMTRQRFGVEVSKHTRVLLERIHAAPRANPPRPRRATSA